ncbi:ATP-binding protein [Methylocystis sp. 9N]|uniref:ATP-binding protein n=1 Tax=Methylocystis borbori TaxID=3118750 RepID=A0ABU7XE31_9HYPH
MTLADHVSIARRFQRSIRLDSDLARVDALQGFVCQRSAADGLLSMASQIAQTAQRAFTWTGPYGGGKSSLAVGLAGLLGPKGTIRTAASAALGASVTQELLGAYQPSRDGWLVVPVVGRRADPVGDIASALEQARRRDGATRGRPRNDVKGPRELIDRLVQEADARPRDGVLLIIDEMGKFLEGAAADGSDIYFFQELAEAASRARGRLVVVGILHQAFEQYASRLGREARDEWAKIQGRFVDVPLIAGVDEVIDLLGRAIVSERRHAETAQSAEAIAQSIRSRRPGTPADLAARLDKCWPLHPVTAVVLGPMSRRRFGQNERSVFGFLASAEPGGFRDFLREMPATARELFGPDRFWDYLRINLEPAILASNDSHRWAQGADAIERCEARGTALHVRLAKAIALIDMFRNGSGMAADRATLTACIPDAEPDVIDAALAELERWSVAVFRKHLDAWAIYAGSDFDIDGAVASAAAQASGLDLGRLARVVGLQPVLAKRHYHETGSLRWFQTELVHLADLGRVADRAGDAAGHFILAIPASEDQRKIALADCHAASERTSEQLIAVGLPRNAWRLRDLGSELVALEAVRTSRPELDGDSVARRELAARIAAVSAELDEELRAGFANADWHVAGGRIDLPAGASLSRLASDLADRRFSQAPRVHSELVNRERPSSNTQAGVRALMHAMISAADKPALGIEGFPVERGLYSTVLAAAGLHHKSGESYGFSKPTNSRIGQTYKPAWEAAEALFARERGTVPLGHLYRLWAAAPFGIRHGLMPILALAFIMANRHRLALYGEGKFQAEIDDYLVDILLQDEDLVALRRVDVDAFRGAILEGVARAVRKATGHACPPDPLEVARRLVRFARDLPPWSQKTLSLSAATAEVRRVLLRADDPHKALFVDIPTIFGDDDAPATAAGIETALRELNDAYPKMMAALSQKMLSALGQAQEDFAELHERARVVADLTGDLRVDAFAARLATYCGEIPEIEAIASLALNRPPRDWTDRDPDQAALALADFALKFRRAETLARVKGRRPTREAMALIIGTGEAGQEFVEEFEIAERDRPKVTALAQALHKILTESGADRNVALAALAETGLDTLAHRDARLKKVG